VKRRDLPPLSYVLHTSPSHVHLFWRVTGFDRDLVERLQKQLARELGTDAAALRSHRTLDCFANHKRARRPHLVTIEYRDVNVRYAPPYSANAVASMDRFRPAPWEKIVQILGQC
jgi:hypothetical protein